MYRKQKNIKYSVLLEFQKKNKRWKKWGKFIFDVKKKTLQIHKLKNKIGFVLSFVKL